ncbi:Integrase core domain protein [Pelotomaculum sp. FP]|uniref:IS21 family transposase n=1 Tax=Pelotomaculum sp. FP TaxID=261474 RepID=UPI001065BBE1|nr:IS21 family transposase [Pelotomaculum sp. FP]TEB15579.1 Integrase core domain protein [Pelotomaculum sp. FP]
MTPYREILRLHSQGISQRSIAASCNCSRNTVARAIEKAYEHNLTAPLPKEFTDEKLGELFYPKKPLTPSNRRMPDYACVHKELARNGVTLSLLWTEYCAECRQCGEVPFMYTQFCHYYREYIRKNKATMHIDRKPGEIMEVDWAGDTATVTDSTVGKELPAYIFVAVLPYSQYAYAEAFLKQDQEVWVSAHVNAYKYFGGVTRILVCDNLRTGVDRVSKSEVVINRTYQELSEHYGTAELSLPESENRGIIFKTALSSKYGRTTFNCKAVPLYFEDNKSA